jgi:hypothetical protein
MHASPEPFRRDLVAHLNVITLRVPPLRDYAEDVPDLLRYYVDRLVDDQHLPLRRFSVAAQNRLRNYPWPGNVGELKNLVQRVLILGAGEEIRLEEIERELAVKLANDEPLVKQDLLALPLREAREQFERAYLQQQLLLCNGKVGQLAKRVGMERTHLYRKVAGIRGRFSAIGRGLSPSAQGALARPVDWVRSGIAAAILARAEPQSLCVAASRADGRRDQCVGWRHGAAHGWGGERPRSSRRIIGRPRFDI